MFGAKTRDNDQVERAQGEDMRDMAFIAREGQQLAPLAEVPVVDAADLFGFAERARPAAADEAATAITKMAFSSSRGGRSRSCLG
jgi:hypothetical protein